MPSQPAAFATAATEPDAPAPPVLSARARNSLTVSDTAGCAAAKAIKSAQDTIASAACAKLADMHACVYSSSGVSLKTQEAGTFSSTTCK